MRITRESFEIEDDIANDAIHATNQHANNSILHRLRSVFVPRWLWQTSHPRRTASFIPLSTNDDPSYSLEEDDDDPDIPRGRWCPEENATFLSRLFFTWVDSLLTQGLNKPLQHDDLWDLSTQDSSLLVSSNFDYNLKSTIDDVRAPNGRVWKALCRAHWKKFFYAGIIKVIHDVVMLAAPFILEMLLKQVQARGSPGKSFGLACLLALIAVLETFTVNIYFHILFRICLHMKTELVDMLYKKSLKIEEASKSSRGIGAITNVMSNDCSKLWSLPTYLYGDSVVD